MLENFLAGRDSESLRHEAIRTAITIVIRVAYQPTVPL